MLDMLTLDMLLLDTCHLHAITYPLLWYRINTWYMSCL